MKKREKRKEKRNLIIVLLILLICVVGIGYSFLTANLSINGTAEVRGSTWDIHFDNLNVTTGSVTAAVEPELTNSTSTSFSVELVNPGDFYEFTVDAVNAGGIDAMVGDITTGTLTDEQKKILSYSVTYSDGLEIKDDDLLKSGSTETIKVRIEYKKDINSSDLPTSKVEVSLPIVLSYVQDDNGNEVVHAG